MPYDIYVLDESDITLSNAGLDGVTQGDGSHMLGQTITLNSGAWYPVSIDDTVDANFGDNEAQTLDGDQVIDGVMYTNGTAVEAEYSLVLTDGTNSYTVVAFNVSNSSPSYGTVEALAFIGGPGGFPPVGVTLTVTSANEFPSFEAATYATPICFASGTMIETPDGLRKVEQIAVGELVCTANGPQIVRWSASRTWPAYGSMAPVLFKAGAIGNVRPLRLSQQHRVLIRGWKAELFFGADEVLVPAKHLLDGDNVVLLTGGSVTYHHLMFDAHQIIRSEGAETESFFVGDIGVSGLEADARSELLRVFPQLEADNRAFGSTAATVLGATEARVLHAA